MYDWLIGNAIQPIIHIKKLMCLTYIRFVIILISAYRVGHYQIRNLELAVLRVGTVCFRKKYPSYDIKNL
jgi:hypothetical protein